MGGWRHNTGISSFLGSRRQALPVLHAHISYQVHMKAHIPSLLLPLLAAWKATMWGLSCWRAALNVCRHVGSNKLIYICQDGQDGLEIVLAGGLQALSILGWEDVAYLGVQGTAVRTHFSSIRKPQQKCDSQTTGWPVRTRTWVLTNHFRPSWASHMEILYVSPDTSTGCGSTTGIWYFSGIILSRLPWIIHQTSSRLIPDSCIHQRFHSSPLVGLKHLYCRDLGTIYSNCLFKITEVFHTCYTKK